MFPHRTSGILLHPTSLPGPNGIGSLGEHAHRFVDFLAQAKQTVWQVLPLGPTGYGDSPYSMFCALAGNPLLISLDRLVSQGDLDEDELVGRPDFKPERIDYSLLIQWKLPLLERAAQRFLDSADQDRKVRFEAFCSAHADWLEPYALFMSAKERFDWKAQAEGKSGITWNTYWDEDIALREPEALARWTEECTDSIRIHKVWQYYFFHQWAALRKHANEKGIRIIGDMPIFVALDSADVWMFPHLFCLDNRARETVVAGVPPDYFSKTGQRWGNPLYNWKEMEKRGFAWWILRIKALLELVDIIRIDHFRGFEAFWAIPAKEKTAVKGKWIKGPGAKLFNALRDAFGDLPILAEDLGVITRKVEALRDAFEFPGMRVLQFAFEDTDPLNPHLPHNHVPNSVVYTGTHDNNTTLGWFNGLKAKQRASMERYLNGPVREPSWDLIHLAMASVARIAVFPMQDVLGMGGDARMNQPGNESGNWTWRVPPDYYERDSTKRLALMTEFFGRAPSKKKKGREEDLDPGDTATS